MDQVEATLRLLMFALALIFGISWLALGLVFRLNLKSAASFSVANLCIGLGSVFAMQRATHPDFLSVQVADWMVIGGITSFWSGIMLLTRKKPPHVAIRYLPLIVEVIATAGLDSGDSTYFFRAVVFNAIASATAIYCLVTSMKDMDAENFNLASKLVVAWPYLGAGLLFGFRAMHLLAKGFGGDAILLEPQRSFTTYHWAFLVILVLINIANIGIVVGKLLMNLSHIAATDPLTGCMNRGAILGRLQLHRERMARHDVPLACVLCDLDNFKQINDRHGHDAGDAALTHAVGTIRKTLRAIDEIGRYGGEEFIILMPDTALIGAHDGANRIRKALEASSFVFKGEKISLTASFGVAALLPDESMESVLRRADLAMYEGKRLGRNRVELSDVTSTETVTAAARFVQNQS